MPSMRALQCTIGSAITIWSASSTASRTADRRGVDGQGLLSIPVRQTMSFRRAYTEWRRYRQTVNELARMSDHELRDIGVLRGDIPFVARRRAL